MVLTSLITKIGALTLKRFPFEIRGWDLEKFDSIDTTDGFGTNTKIYIHKNNIVLIEPDYNNNNFNNWISDRARQMFDGTYEQWNQNLFLKHSKKTESWTKIIRFLHQKLYLFDLCNTHKAKNYFFNIIFGNISLEMLSMLSILSQHYNFINIRKTDSIKTNNDLESLLQLNNASENEMLSRSTLSLIITNNPRLEGYPLNLGLRQRICKGNFKCLNFGSILNLTFPIYYIGSNFNTLLSISEGNHIVCQDFKISTNPMIILNNEISKRNDSKNVINMFKMLYYSNLINKIWNGFNILNSTLSETGTKISAQFKNFYYRDFIHYSSLYFINVNLTDIPMFEKIIKLKILNFIPNETQSIKKLFIDHKLNYSDNLFYTTKLLEKIEFFEFKNHMVYGEETFINTEGYYKKTFNHTKLENTKNSWQFLRKFIKHSKTKLNFLDNKNNQSIAFNFQSIACFKNFINFQFYASKNLTYLNYYLNLQSEPFITYKKANNFKNNKFKIFSTLIKYWLDDFFSGCKDLHSDFSSLSLVVNSDILRLENTNFFNKQLTQW